MSAAACLLVAGAVLALPEDGRFTLGWTHSVERTAWREDWRRDGARLVLEGAWVQGSGAGMEPGPGAVREGDGWAWTPAAVAVEALMLAASGATGGGWTLCAGGACREVGAASGEALRIAPCD